MKTILQLAICVLFLGICQGLVAQTPSDAIMMKKREACFGLIYEYGSWDQYWEGTLLRENATVATVKRNTVLPMIAIGVIDRINVIVALPYVKTLSSEPNGGRFEGAKGFQDLTFAVKGQVVEKELGKGKLNFLTTVGFSTPVSNYLSDYRPYSIGNGTNEVSVRGILQYKLDNGVYVRTALAHLWRGLTEAERDYYYNNGSYYTALMDVPNAWNYHFVAGIWMLGNSLKLEANYEGLSSTSGDDIRKYNAGQPTNKVQFGQVGASAQYYFKQPKGLGLLAYYSQIVSGRNMGKFSMLGAGVTYQFKF